jgi:hypothetical protein
MAAPEITEKEKSLLKEIMMLVVHACNPIYLDGRSRRIAV